ncbi:recombinase RecA [Salinarchaeum sp. IM2453]|uniref:RAD55 family ATPase n=1 Tax=Salinarchaeum sp. IM2453 TaxID=2862870 RepID=UPI001C8381CD|nr:ATPase domain-containing protein [Salinarchaeum sp. IM2453]QZA88407.1 recombinase RecA [Salinarchaeum sp. IM2453]
MYDIGDVLEDTVIAPGSNILISGPPMTGKQSLAYDILAQGTRNDEGAIIVTTKDNSKKTLSKYEDRINRSVDDVPVAVVDCVSRQQGMSNTEDTRHIKYASSPVDMTGIGINLSELLEDFYENQGIKRNRVLLHSISTLLMYSDLQTVFRFLHVFTGRISSADALGIYVIDPTTHDEQEVNTLKQLFDGMIEVDEQDGKKTVRSSGLPTR